MIELHSIGFHFPRFREQSVVVTQKIHKIGLEEFEKRKAEHKIFLDCVAVGKKKVQIEGQK
jgi:hypothetical protein